MTMFGRTAGVIAIVALAALSLIVLASVWASPAQPPANPAVISESGKVQEWSLDGQPVTESLTLAANSSMQASVRIALADNSSDRRIASARVRERPHWLTWLRFAALDGNPSIASLRGMQERKRVLSASGVIKVPTKPGTYELQLVLAAERPGDFLVDKSTGGEVISAVIVSIR
jgi:hypothetical protein